MSFVNVTRHSKMVQTMTDQYKQRIDNPFYLYTDKKPTITTYYNINKNATTVDPGTLTHYSLLGDQSPLRYNKIKNCYLFGIGKMEVDASMEDFGIEASEISGEFYVLPNTFIPMPNDFFSINYLDSEILFKVNSVTPDTLPNGSNFYRASYSLDQHDHEEGSIEKQVVKNFTMRIENLGTDQSVLMTDEQIDYTNSLNELISRLRKYYKALFYDEDVLTFVFRHKNTSFYDPYMIEFIKRNDILHDDSDYIFIQHRTVLSNTFCIEYDRTVFKALEDRSLEALKSGNTPFSGVAVEECNSLLSSRYDAYYQMTYSKYTNMSTVDTFHVFDTDEFDHIVNNEKYSEEDKLFYNIIIRWLNDEDINDTLIDDINSIDFVADKTCFYMIPILLFILEYTLNNYESNTEDDSVDSEENDSSDDTE